MSCSVVRLTTEEFNRLLEYSSSLPTGTTIGKRWRRNLNWSIGGKAEWWMGEYVESAAPNRVDIEWKEIEIFDSPFRDLAKTPS